MEKQHKESKYIEKELVPFNSETLCLSEVTVFLDKISVKLPLQLFLQKKHFSKIPASFNENLEHISINSRIEVAKFEPEPIFEKTIHEIRDNHLKSITSITMNLSYKTKIKPSLYSEDLKSDFMPCILLQSPGKSPQFTKICLQCTLKKTSN